MSSDFPSERDRGPKAIGALAVARRKLVIYAEKNASIEHPFSSAIRVDDLSLRIGQYDPSGQEIESVATAVFGKRLEIQKFSDCGGTLEMRR